MGKKGTGKVERVCFYCDKIFFARHDRLGKYCSLSCRSKDVRTGITYFEFTCIECNSQFKRQKGQEKYNKFCKRSCMINSIKNGNVFRPSGDKHPNWKGGITKRPYIARKAVLMAKKIKKECERCGCKENLQGHHKIKYSERPDLCNDINNIEVICINCHALEHPEMANMLSRPIKRSGKIINCIICNNERYIGKSLFNTAKYCSKKCQLISLHEKRRVNYHGRKVDSKSN